MVSNVIMKNNEKEVARKLCCSISLWISEQFQILAKLCKLLQLLPQYHALHIFHLFPSPHLILGRASALILKETPRSWQRITSWKCIFCCRRSGSSCDNEV